MNRIILFITMLSYSVFAQITINSSDIASQFSIGHSATVYESESPATIDIGSPGGGNNWDFTSLQNGFTSVFTSVDPATTPYINEFTGADITLHSMGMYNGEQAEIWGYSQLNGSFAFMGNAITLVSQPGDLFTIKDNPPSQDVVFPLTFNSSWMQTFTETVEFNSMQIEQSTYSIDVTCDAYGTMTLPGGESFDALRLRYVETDGVETTVDYNFYSLSGAQVYLYASDSNPPVSGVIDLDGYSWNLQITSSVEQINNIPTDYYLTQNYPNPFNPGTVIKYQIPETEFVTLKIYDVLGNEIAVLVDEEEPAGTYEIEFNAAGLTSGIYFYKLQTGNFVQTKKMILLR